METRMMKIREIKPDPQNPRKDLTKDDSEYLALKRSIEEFGYVLPIIINKRNHMVVGGHQRLKVLMDLGREEVLCVLVDLEDDYQKLLNIGLNKIKGEFNWEELEAVISQLHADGHDTTITGFSIDEIDNLIGNFDPLAEDESSTVTSNEQDDKETTVICPKCQHMADKEAFKI